ncbi:MAG: phage tail tape measure protein [Hyphomicrobium sp.]|uniref:phage tail tape measure protein n=1 Tax=Hyphomicrobium sp. TaxID=82 RepID=UPI003D0A61D8
MAGPLDLRGRVSFTQNGGVLGAVQRQLQQIGAQTGKRTVPMGTFASNALVTGAANARRFQGSVVGATAGTWALVSAMKKAEDFNRNVFGVGVAAIGDYTSRDGLGKVVVDMDKVRASMERVSKVSRDLAHEIPETPTKLSGIAETLAKAGFGDEKLAAATKWAAILGTTDTETAASDLGAFASVLDTIYKPQQGEAWGEFFKRQLDIVRVAAAETRLSLASTMEGLRPFSALYSILGQSETENAMMLMAGVRKGGEAAEVGHTLKSNMLRMLRSTAESTSRFSALGLRRSDYTDLSAMDPMRASGNLSRVFRNAEIKGKFRSHLESMMQKAIEDGTFDTDEFQTKIMGMVAKRGNIDLSDELSREAFEEKFANAIFAGGARFNMLKLLEDLIAKGATAADIGTIFEGRRIGTNTQILEGIKEFGPEFLSKLNNADGTGLLAVLEALQGSDYGRLQKFSAMLEDFQIKLANSEGFQKFLTGLTMAFDALGKAPAWLTNVAVAAGILGIALTPLAMAFRGLAALAGGLRWLAGLVGLGGGAAAGRGLFSLGSAATGVGAAAAAAAASKKIGQMGALTRSGSMISGMSAAGGAAGAVGSTAAGLGGLLGKGAGMVGRFARWLPWIGMPLMALGAGWGAADAYEKGGSWWDVIKGAGFGALGLGGEAHAAQGPADTELPAVEVDQGATGGLDVASQGQQAVSDAQSLGAQIQAAFASIDFAAIGQQMMAQLAAGITAGGAQAVAAANNVASQVRAAGQRVQLNTGPNMQPAR